MSYSSRSRRRRFTVLDFKSWAYSRICGHFSNICTAHAHRSIRRPRFPIRMQNFGDLATFSVDYCILYSECLPYFYFRFVWPTDPESIPHAPTRTLLIRCYCSSHGVVTKRLLTYWDRQSVDAQLDWLGSFLALEQSGSQVSMRWSESLLIESGKKAEAGRRGPVQLVTVDLSGHGEGHRCREKLLIDCLCVFGCVVVILSDFCVPYCLFVYIELL